MPRPLFDSEFIFGLHDPGGEQNMADMGRKGWILFTEELGADPNNASGRDYLAWANAGYGVIVRLNHGYGEAGTLPHSSRYSDFARRCANFVRTSRGAKLWVIGNEMNFSREWPLIPSAGAAASVQPTVPLRPPLGPESDPFGHGDPNRFGAIRQPAAADAGQRIRPAAAAPQQMITPDLYVQCYRLVRDAIHAITGHADDQVLVGAVAPWNANAVYPGNEIGDWIRYFQDILQKLGPGGCDGMTVHTYTHGTDPNLVNDAGKMNPPFQNRHYHFFAYRDFMNAVPANMRALPLYITETDQDEAWLDQNTGWVKRAYAEINWWNTQGNNQQIRALILYRWPRFDKWYIEGKQGVITDFRESMQNDYRWRQSSFTFSVGDIVRTLEVVNLRRSPAGETVTQLGRNVRLRILAPAKTATGLIWWNVRVEGANPVQEGWVAQVTTTGIVLLVLESTGTLPPDPNVPGAFRPGDSVRTLTIVRMRRTPGVTNKPPADVVADIPDATTLTVLEGPKRADGMNWWRCRGILIDGRTVDGWMADATADGIKLLDKVPPATTTPDPNAPFKTGDRVRTLTIVRMRRSPGSANKPPLDIIAEIPQGQEGTVLNGPQTVDSMRWWQTRIPDGSGNQPSGWMADSLPDGSRLLEKVGGTPPAPSGKFRAGDLIVTADRVLVRRSPGYQNKAGDDVLGDFWPEAVLNVLDGPSAKDGLTWWRVAGITSAGVETRGYSAEVSPTGGNLLIKAPVLPGTSIPNHLTGLFLAAPYAGVFGISQLWGENPAFYSQYNYDGVALLGHNGIDFLTPTGTQLVATEAGRVIGTGFEAGGFGNFILLEHSWGNSVYGHLDSVQVALGSIVVRGQQIGFSGNTGGSSGPHLHFAIRINPYVRGDGWGGYNDPLPYLPPGSFILPDYVQESGSILGGPPAGAGQRQKPSSMGSVPGDKRP